MARASKSIAPAAPGSPPALLYIWDDRFLWVSSYFKGRMTHRYATNLVLSLSGPPFLLQQPRGTPQPCAAALCAARAVRSLDASGTPFLSLNLDPGTAEAAMLEALLDDNGVMPVERERFAALDPELAALLHGSLETPQVRALTERILAILTGRTPAPQRIDERVRRVAEHLRTELPIEVNAESLAALAGVSAMRLMHLFAEQYGLPMSSYLLWSKLRRAVSLVQRGQSLTEIAQACGFADSSHLTRTFQGFYAIRPSLLADSSYVQVRLC